MAFVREAVAAGVRHIDTAHLYTGGESERAIGEALDGVCEDVLVATKGGYRAGEGRPEVLGAQIEQSLRSLRTEAIGLYYLHRVDPETPLEESLGAIKELRRPRRDPPRRDLRGERRADRARPRRRADRRRAEPLQPAPSASTTTSSTSASARGSRSCRTTRCAATAAGRSPSAAQRLGATENAVKLAWLLRRSPVVLPIPGTLSIEHLRENLAALELDLGDVAA